ncbi:hypothetical protein DACRYDRAFT_21387 [Dacryopinax primogenitus]|uniref:Uncharacterized protein n=1 Tax=Dacryopinax primogenitus (strain DJM 731) TaxID=1858805 RepID=M5GAP9_DACPD|nr:uncharacterized protein DACRYDRAFT_21387 [Dacryopinax primogenitus]EJU03042.1 hypothetical protein DACRYDRAFT_21387 [Dacryopinax primogenitus]
MSITYIIIWAGGKRLTLTLFVDGNEIDSDDLVVTSKLAFLCARPAWEKKACVAMTG